MPSAKTTQLKDMHLTTKTPKLMVKLKIKKNLKNPGLSENSRKVNQPGRTGSSTSPSVHSSRIIKIKRERKSKSPIAIKIKQERKSESPIEIKIKQERMSRSPFQWDVSDDTPVSSVERSPSVAAPFPSAASLVYPQPGAPISLKPRIHIYRNVNNEIRMFGVPAPKPAPPVTGSASVAKVRLYTIRGGAARIRIMPAYIPAAASDVSSAAETSSSSSSADNSSGLAPFSAPVDSSSDIPTSSPTSGSWN